MRMGIPSCMLVCAAHRDAAQHVAEIRSTHTSCACSTGVVYVHSCMLACTYCHSNACQFTAYTPNMQAVHTCSRAAQSMYVYLHRHVCMWSTRASRAVHVYLQDANASNVRFAAHVARVCTDVRGMRGVRACGRHGVWAGFEQARQHEQCNRVAPSNTAAARSRPTTEQRDERGEIAARGRADLVE